MNPDVTRPIAPQIKAVREFYGLNPTDFAKLAGISRVYLYALESGKKKPSWEVVARVFNVDNSTG